MTPRTYALAAIAIAGSMFAALAATNLAIDPQGVFGTNWLPPSANANERYLKFVSYEKARHDYEGLFFGSSRSGNISRDDLSSRMNGVKFADFSVTGATLPDHLPVIEFVLRQKAAEGERLRAIFILLDIDHFGDPALTNQTVQTLLHPTLTGMNPIKFWWKEITVVQFKVWRSAIREAWGSTRQPTAPLPTTSINPATIGPPATTFIRPAAAATLPTPSIKAAATDPPPTTSIKPLPLIRITKRPDFATHTEMLKQIVRLCREKDIEFILVTSPLHRANEIQFDPTDLSDAIARISRITPIWDFTGSSSLTDHPELWMGDISHFSPDVSRMILRRVFGDPMPVGWEDFGRLRGR